MIPRETGTSEAIWGYNDNVTSRVSQPEECFRLTVDEGLDRNYLAPYEVTLTLSAANLTWGSIAWDEFKGITCDGKMFTPDVDVCQLLADDVDMLPMPTAIPVVQQSATPGTPSNNVERNTLAGFNLLFEDAADNRHRFTAMWYLNDRTKEKDDTRNLYAGVDLDDAVAPTGTAFQTGAELDAMAPRVDTTDNPHPNLVYGAESGITYAADGTATVAATAIRTVWVPTLDDDFDPMYGDLGKTSNGLNTADNFQDDDDSNMCDAADGGSAASPTGALNSTLCNAEDVPISTSVSFVDGMGYGCDPVKVDYTLTCQWDARGESDERCRRRLRCRLSDQRRQVRNRRIQHRRLRVLQGGVGIPR